ncbi:TIGR01777 family oxidoreductase [Aquimarina sp. 2201CG5-10]|uniref:TIGR01777 family oxidoreductase n=1 Tax=Aquimarina callyspongiae TaxID=3098150 RepID=UPI002AB5A8A8|nr:TIGR01777 family oxidoreductase [Aquimarina sp. 2201CG5-10]MDY8134489.1 TIGR01777 family oxidoreductase [Aquimarina sp. 2201CG5-10]
MKKIVIAAGTGFLGKILINHFKSKTEKIIVLTRGKTRTENHIHFVHWNAKTLGGWKNELNNADALINLTGKSVDCRYNQRNKDLILNSRIESTLILGKAIEQCIHPPKVWINSSTATIYRHSLDKEMTETTGEIGSGFSVNVATSWEKTFFTQSTPHTRKVAIRTSIVLGTQGGALPPIIKLVKIGLGGSQGQGNQKFSWIHETDFARSIAFIINNQDIKGVINIVSPKPTTNTVLMKTLRSALNVSIGITLSKPILELGAYIIKTETELILKSRNVIPEKLIHHGFNFLYPHLDQTLNDLTR